jgi:hypothetical protein
MSGLLAFGRAANLFHETEQEVGGLFVQVQALDKATGNSYMAQLQPIGGNVQFVERVAGQLQYLTISTDSLASQQFDAKLGMLTVAPASGRFVAKDWSGILKAQRQRAMLVVIQIETADGGGIFGSQAQISVMQAKGIEVLPEFLPETGRKEVAVLKQRRVYPVVSGPSQQCAQALDDVLLLSIGIWQEVMHPPQPLNPFLHTIF